jgi:hypothetical protein
MNETEEARVRDYETHDEETDRLVRIIARVVAGKSIEVGYREANKNGWEKWMLALAGGLALMGVGGGVMMYGKLSAIEANQISQQRQLDSLSAIVASVRRPP